MNEPDYTLNSDKPVGICATQNTGKLVMDGKRRAAQVLIETLERDERRLQVFMYHVLQAAGRAGVEAECFTDDEVAAKWEEMSASPYFMRSAPQLVTPFNPTPLP